METTRYYCMVNINKINNYFSLIRIAIIYTNKKRIVMVNFILRKKLLLNSADSLTGGDMENYRKDVPKTYTRYRCRYSKIPIRKIQYRYF